MTSEQIADLRRALEGCGKAEADRSSLRGVQPKTRSSRDAYFTLNVLQQPDRAAWLEELGTPWLARGVWRCALCGGTSRHRLPDANVSLSCIESLRDRVAALEAENERLKAELELWIQDWQRVAPRVR